MKRLILFTILIGLAVMSYGQRRSPDGLGVGPKATWATDGYIKRITVDAVNNTVTFYDASDDSLEFKQPNALDVSDYFVSRTPDTVLVTSGIYYLKVTDAGKMIRANRTSANGPVSIFIPPDSTAAIPIGSIINVKMDNTGKVNFKAGTGVILQAKNDSLGIGVRHGWATLIKRTSLKWDALGDLQD